MPVRKVTRFEADDGSLFETLREAEVHDEIVNIEVALRSLPSRLGIVADTENAAAMYRVGLRFASPLTTATEPASD